MKLSLAWIFDHLDARMSDYDAHAIEQLLNKKTAEVDRVRTVRYTPDAICLWQMGTQTSAHHLTERHDVKDGQWVLVAHDKDGYRWATMRDLGGESNQLLPAVAQQEQWQQFIEPIDYIFEIDNTSITHRPDLWGHRGFARELSVLLDIPLVPEQEFLADLSIAEHAKTIPASATHPYSVTIADETCSRFSTIYIQSISAKPSDIHMAQRLARIDVRPIDFLVDVTNYVMFDIGHPLHAFDGDALGHNSSLTIRPAQEKELIRLLDDTTYTLTKNDCVIANQQHALSLAGVMGGHDSGVRDTTRSILLEAACFDPTVIRLTSARHKLRTDASTRFEKKLDPHQATLALARAYHLLAAAQPDIVSDMTVHALGQLPATKVITIAHTVIESRLGVTLTHDFVIHTLEKLGFTVTDTGDTYTIIVPSYRATKDIMIPEDIIEEIGRIYGYDAIVPQLPYMPIRPLDMHAVTRVDAIKKLCAYGLSMKEVYTYAFYDEEFLQTLAWHPDNALTVQNPVSQNWRQLLTTMIPNLLDVVAKNYLHEEQVRFFELARIWEKTDQLLPIERKRLAGVWFSRHEPVDFYMIQAAIMNLFHMLRIPVRFEQIAAPDYPWYMPHKTAAIYHEDTMIGTIGVVPDILVDRFAHGYAGVCELDADFLISYQSPKHMFEPLSKYQTVERDISILIPLSVTTRQIMDAIQAVDPRVTTVTLIDHFEKDEWRDKKSITVRYLIVDTTKTLTSEEILAIEQNVAACVQRYHGEMRA